LKQLARSGRILPTDSIWREGDADRRPAATVPGLFPERTASPRADGPPTGAPSEPVGPARDRRDAPRAGISLLGVVGTLAGLLAIALGGGASFLYWTHRLRDVVMPAAMLGLLLGNLVLLKDWSRGRGRFSIAVLGVTASTVSLVTAFVDTGGLERTRQALRQVLAILPGGEAPQPEKTADGPTELEKKRFETSPPPSEDMTKDDLIAKIESLGNPCPRQDLFKLVGEPQRKETKAGQLAGLLWYWRCKDGTVEVVLLNPELASGDEKDPTMASISKINDRP
jgi:hypothetical protein